LIYFPTSYGTTVSNGAGIVTAGAAPNDATTARPGLTSAEIEAERTASIDANLARIKAELEAKKAEIDALLARISDNR
jgi:hypothetical protein